MGSQYFVTCNLLEPYWWRGEKGASIIEDTLSFILAKLLRSLQAIKCKTIHPKDCTVDFFWLSIWEDFSVGAGFYGKRWISFDIPRMMDSYKYTSQYQILFDSCWLTKARRLLAFDKIIAHQQIFSAVFVIKSNCGIFCLFHNGSTHAFFIFSRQEIIAAWIEGWFFSPETFLSCDLVIIYFAITMM